jgi:hypothetical protein
MPRVGVATLPLDIGKCPRWLFERMRRLSRAVILAIVEEFGAEELLRRLSDPVWFQSLSATIGMDWNSSGTTTITLGAIKSGIFDIQNELGLYVCGGKKVSRKTPEEIEKYSEILGLIQETSNKLIYTSKMAAKVDSSLIQNPLTPFQLYHHNFIFTKSGEWSVIQQSMSPIIQKARRYHWLSSKVSDFTQEPHSGIVVDVKSNPLNLVAKESFENKEISAEIVKEEPKKFLKDFSKIINKSDALIRQRRLGNFTEMELNDVEFHWHPVLKEKFDLKRLKKTIFTAHSENPENFEQLLALKGVGPKTIRALSLVSEIIYGARPSYQDPARYSFAHGGKDLVPYKVDLQTLSQTTQILENAIKRAKIENRERASAIKRLHNLTH